MPNVITKKTPRPSSVETLGEARSDSTGANKFWRTSTEEDDNQDEHLLQAAACPTSRKKKSPQPEQTDSLQVITDNGSVTMKLRRTLMDYYRHKEEPFLIGKLTFE